MVHYLSRMELEEISHWSTCSISNGIELFNIRPRNEGFMLPEIKCIFPELGPMIGYAVTAMISADSPGGRRIEPAEWWEEILKIPEPRIAVIHDLDQPVVGSFWGEVNGSIHKALGCVGVVTDGGVRDLDVMQSLEVHAFAAHVLAARAHAHMVGFGIPVRVGALTVSPGDLLHGDKHGITIIPQSVAAEVASAAARLERQERQIIELCQSSDFTLDALKDRWKKLRGSY